MGTKANPSKFDCYANAAPDEPMFVLLGRDVHAAALVEEWANARVGSGVELDKVREARQVALDMRAYCEGLGKQPKRLASPKWVVVVEDRENDVLYSTLCYSDGDMEAAYIHAQEPNEPLEVDEGELSDFARECIELLRSTEQWNLLDNPVGTSLDLRFSHVSNFEGADVQIMRLNP